MDPALILFGFMVGLLVGMTGIGGGSLMTPLLILVFGVKPVVAIGTDLAYGAVTKTVGGFKHFRQGTVDLSLSAWIAIGSVPTAIGGVYVLEALQGAHGDAFDDLLLQMLSAALLITGLATLGRALFMKKLVAREREGLELTRRHKATAVCLGGFVGFVLGLTSAGSGAFIAVGLILLFQLVPTRVVGTDVFHAAILLWAAAIAHLVAGNVDFAMAGTMLLGSVPGVWLGSHWSVRVPAAALRTMLAVLLIGAGTGLLSKSGVGVPGYVVAAFPLSIVVLVAVTLVRRSRLDKLRPVEAVGPGDDRTRVDPQPLLQQRTVEAAEIAR
jgi:uncharacterized membrane protein YfcA